MGIRRGVDRAVGKVVEFLEELSTETKGKSEIAQVGTISANSNTETVT